MAVSLLGIVLSVGTSLLGGFRAWLSQQGAQDSDALALMQGRSPEFEKYLAWFCATLRAASGKPENVRFPSAELQTLGIFFATNPDLKLHEKRVALYHVVGPEGQACAAELGRVLEGGDLADLIMGRGAAQVEVVGLPLNVDDQREFAEQIVELLARVRRHAARYRKEGCDRIIVGATGGYKAMTPFMSLLGFLDGEEVLYGYEASSAVLTIPQFPFAWDIRFLDEFRGHLSAGAVPVPVYRALPEKFRQFFLSQPEQGPEGPVHRMSPFGRMIAEDYRQSRHLRFGYGKPLLERFEDQALRARVERLVQTEWQYLWLGDQIPETVEHTRGHSARLLELARDLIGLTGLRLDDHELFVLIAAIWLHDIGHGVLTAEAVKAGDERFPLFLFPSQVRHLHHICSAELIGGLASLDPGTTAAVAQVARYHRRESPLGKGDPTWRNERFGLALPPMPGVIREPMCVEGHELRAGSLLLLTAFLRFIDACDVQADRVVNEDYARARQRRTDAEIQVYLDRLRRLAEGAASAAARYAETLSGVFVRVERALDTWDGTSESRAERKQLCEDIIEQAVATLQEGRRRPGWLEALGLADSILLKREQEAHFLKHGAIQCVYLGPGGRAFSARDGLPRVRIYLLASWGEAAAATEARAELRARIRKVAREIWEEYEAVRTVLDPLFQVEGVYWNDGAMVEKAWPQSPGEV